MMRDLINRQVKLPLYRTFSKKVRFKEVFAWGE